jgi:hypothetical protein
MGAGKTTFYACHRDLPSGSVGPQMAQLQKAFSVSGGVKVPIGQLGMTTISALILRRNQTFQIHQLTSSGILHGPIKGMQCTQMTPPLLEPYTQYMFNKQPVLDKRTF